MLELTFGATAQLDANGQKRHLILLSAACCGFRASPILPCYYPADLARRIRPFVDLLLTRRGDSKKLPGGAARNVLICYRILVAGAGFEPAAFRL